MQNFLVLRKMKSYEVARKGFGLKKQPWKQAPAYQNSEAIRHIRVQRISSHELSGSSRKYMSSKRGQKVENEKKT